MQEQLYVNKITADRVSIYTEKNIELTILRLDKIHPFISGNKWFKLRYYLEEAISTGKKNIITFGGAWSNHIVAAAAICELNQITCTGIIRGEEPGVLSPTLSQAKQMGMHLVFISREDYRQKIIPSFVAGPDDYVIDEGGYGAIGAKGASTIIDLSNKDYSHYCCASGTGTMLAGLINAALPAQQVIGISVLKNNMELHEKTGALVTNKAVDWRLFHEYHFGGYAKSQPVLIRFMNEFYGQTGTPSDFVYTGKLFYAIADLIQKDFFVPGSRILAIHSGGLQGNLSLDKGTLIF